METHCIVFLPLAFETFGRTSDEVMSLHVVRDLVGKTVEINQLSLVPRTKESISVVDEDTSSK